MKLKILKWIVTSEFSVSLLVREFKIFILCLSGTKMKNRFHIQSWNPESFCPLYVPLLWRFTIWWTNDKTTWEVTYWSLYMRLIRPLGHLNWNSECNFLKYALDHFCISVITLYRLSFPWYPTFSQWYGLSAKKISPFFTIIAVITVLLLFPFIFSLQICSYRKS